MILHFTIIFIIGLLLYYNFSLFHRRDYKYIEYSCKFSKSKTYNDTRKLYAFDSTKKLDVETIFKKYNVDSKLIYFYNKMLKKRPQTELAYGEDTDVNVAKLYINDGSNIYGIEKRNTDYSIRIYKPDLYFEKDELDTFLGYEKSSLFYKLFNIPDDVVVYKKYDQNHDFKLNFYLIYLEGYKVYDYREQIKALLIKYDCNIEGIDKWINKNKDYYMYWVAIGKKNNSIEVTFYYRIK